MNTLVHQCGLADHVHLAMFFDMNVLELVKHTELVWHDYHRIKHILPAMTITKQGLDDYKESKSI